MRHYILKYLGILTLIMSFVACKKDDPIVPPVLPDPKGTIEIRFLPTMNGNPLAYNQIFQGPNGKRMLLETFRAYLSNIRFETADGNQNTLSDIELVDLGTGSNSISLTSIPNTYTALHFGIGVPNNLNGTSNPNFSPAAYPIEHPLSVYNGMYWSWATGYIFLKVEGRIDTTTAQDQTPLYTFFYHTGIDTLYQEHTVNNLNLQVKDGQTSVLEFAIEVNDLFITPGDTINMVDDYFTHTTDNIELARKIIQNFGTALHKL